MTDAFVTDTHPFLWYLTDDPRLSEAARKVFERADRGDLFVVVPAVVLIECLHVLERKRIEYDFGQLVHRIDEAPGYIVWPLDLETVLAMAQIGRTLELHDRAIVATARQWGAGLISRDGQILAAQEVKVYW